MGEHYAWKFLLPDDGFTQHPTIPELSYKGIVAVAIATTEVAARAQLVSYALARGHDPRWLDCVPSAQRFKLDRDAVVCWAEV